MRLAFNRPVNFLVANKNSNRLCIEQEREITESNKYKF